MRVRGLECFAAARLGLGGQALPQAAECARQLIELAPFRETGYVILGLLLLAAGIIGLLFIRPEADRKRLAAHAVANPSLGAQPARA